MWLISGVSIANVRGAHIDRKESAVAAKTEVAEKATFVTDDKRAQYARLVVFNFAVKEKLVKKGDADVNSVSDSVLSKAADSLVGGNMLDGKEGIELIQALTKAGATDEKVAKRGLTTAYAQEVRPFLRRKMLAPSFGRRSKPKAEKPAKEAKKDKASGGKKKEGEPVAA